MPPNKAPTPAQRHIHKEINAALTARLRAMGLPTQYESSGFRPVRGALYVAEFYLPAEIFAVEGGGEDEYRGLYQVSVFAPRDEAETVGMKVAGDVVAQFPRETVLIRPGLKVLYERATQYPGLPSGDRWVIPIRVQFLAIVKKSSNETLR